MLIESISKANGGKKNKKKKYKSLLNSTYFFDIIVWTPARLNKFPFVCDSLSSEAFFLL